MDSKRFDSLAKTVGRRRSRRSAIHALTGAALTAASAKLGLASEPAVAAPVTTERRFNCLVIGDSCNGKDDNCCSGRCEGKKSKKGKKDKNGKRQRDREDRTKCVAHDEQGCTGAQDQDTCSSGIRVACGGRSGGGCLRTTGNAGYCGQIQGGPTPPRLACAVCDKDKDCDALGYGPDAACVVCASSCEFENSRSTACVGPAD